VIGPHVAGLVAETPPAEGDEGHGSRSAVFGMATCWSSRGRAQAGSSTLKLSIIPLS
jgi:hypothetical protein